MNAKTMEGLAGASASINMMSTPMNVAKEAERKGDTEKMQRALGYAAGLAEQAEKYGEKTSQGMKLEAEEAKEQEKLRQEELAKNQNAGQTGQIKPEKQENADLDTSEISEEGKSHPENGGQACPGAVEGAQNIVYDKAGETVGAALADGGHVDVSA